MSWTSTSKSKNRVVPTAGSCRILLDIFDQHGVAKLDATCHQLQFGTWIVVERPNGSSKWIQLLVLRMENYGKLHPNISLMKYPLLLYILFQDAQLPSLMACCAANVENVMCWLLVVLCKPHRKSWILSQESVDASDVWQHMIAFGGELYFLL